KTQPALIQSKQGRIPRLAHLNIRPNISGNRQTSGVLEAHTNGLRFVSKLGNVGMLSHFSSAYHFPLISFYTCHSCNFLLTISFLWIFTYNRRYYLYQHQALFFSTSG